VSLSYHQIIFLQHVRFLNNFYLITPDVKPYIYNWNGPREGLTSTIYIWIQNASGSYCTKLIQMSDWKFLAIILGKLFFISFFIYN